MPVRCGKVTATLVRAAADNLGAAAAYPDGGKRCVKPRHPATIVLGSRRTFDAPRSKFRQRQSGDGRLCLRST